MLPHDTVMIRIEYHISNDAACYGFVELSARSPTIPHTSHSLPNVGSVELYTQGYIVYKKHPPPWDHHRSAGIGLLQGPAGGVGSNERGTSVRMVKY